MTPEEMREFKRTSRLMRIVSTARGMFIDRCAIVGPDGWEVNRQNAQDEMQRAIRLAEQFEDHAEAWMESE